MFVLYMFMVYYSLMNPLYIQKCYILIENKEHYTEIKPCRFSFLLLYSNSHDDVDRAVGPANLDPINQPLSLTGRRLLHLLQISKSPTPLKTPPKSHQLHPAILQLDSTLCAVGPALTHTPRSQIHIF